MSSISDAEIAEIRYRCLPPSASRRLGPRPSDDRLTRAVG